MRARALCLVALLVAVAIAPACSSSPSTVVVPPGGAGYGGRFVYPLRFEPLTLNFVTLSDQTSDYVAPLVGDGLVDRDADLRLGPRPAGSWGFTQIGRAPSEIQ